MGRCVSLAEGSGCVYEMIFKWFPLQQTSVQHETLVRLFPDGFSVVQFLLHLPEMSFPSRLDSAACGLQPIVGRYDGDPGPPTLPRIQNIWQLFQQVKKHNPDVRTCGYKILKHRLTFT